MNPAVMGKDALSVWYVTEPLEGMSKQRMFEAVGCITLAIRCGMNIPRLHDRLAELYAALGAVPKPSKGRKAKQEKVKMYQIHGCREEGKPRYDDDRNED
jgi:hypothetical protein